MGTIFGISVIAIIMVGLLHPVQGKIHTSTRPNKILVCEDCGYLGAEIVDCHGQNASEQPTYQVCRDEEKDFDFDYHYHCSRKFVIRGPDDPDTPEIVERRACIPTPRTQTGFLLQPNNETGPPYFGCNISHPGTILSPGTIVECFCNDIRGEEFIEQPDKDNGEQLEYIKERNVHDDGLVHHQSSHEYCNARLECFQCTDCFLPKNPAVCQSTKSQPGPGGTTMLEREWGRLAFCIVEVKDGIVKRGCAQDAVNYPNDEYPDCGEMHWDHFIGKCKCFGQRCNKNFFYVNDNLGRKFVEDRALILPTPRFQLPDPPKDKDKKFQCLVCDDESEPAASCLRKADENIDGDRWQTCKGEKPYACFREYVHEETSDSIIKRYRIKSKGCTALFTGFPPPSAVTLRKGWIWYDDPQSVPRVIFYCDTHRCNVATKCHQCTGSATQCDTVTPENLRDCDDEFLAEHEKDEYSTTRVAVGAAHYCSILMSGYLVRRACHAAMDFGSRLGYFGLKFPQDCSVWAWKGKDTTRVAKFEECSCAGNGCNSNEIISLSPRPVVVNLTRNWDNTVGGGTGAGKGEGSQSVGSDSALFFFLAVSALFTRF